MVKRTLYFGNPAYLKTRNEQMVIERLTEDDAVIPIEDIGIVILDHQQITITQLLLAKLIANNTALITCDASHHPIGLQLCLDGHTLQSQKFKAQLNVSIPLKKQLWQQTVVAKIQNQSTLLLHQRIETNYLQSLAMSVRSGDSTNNEAKAAAYYWKNIFPEFLQFKRDRDGDPPNNLLNYGYAILRAIVARSLVSSGLLPTLGIFHRNQYNAYCLADDMMEPYRPYVDRIVCEIIRSNGTYLEMTPNMKKSLLQLPNIDVIIDGRKSPLMIAVQNTTASLCKCFEGKSRKISFPVMENG